MKLRHLNLLVPDVANRRLMGRPLCCLRQGQWVQAPVLSHVPPAGVRLSSSSLQLVRVLSQSIRQGQRVQAPALSHVPPVGVRLPSSSLQLMRVLSQSIRQGQWIQAPLAQVRPTRVRLPSSSLQLVRVLSQSIRQGQWVQAPLAQVRPTHVRLCCAEYVLNSKLPNSAAPKNYFAEMDSDANFDSLRRVPCEAILNSQPCETSPDRMVFTCRRGSENRHDAGFGPPVSCAVNPHAVQDYSDLASQRPSPALNLATWRRHPPVFEF